MKSALDNLLLQQTHIWRGRDGLKKNPPSLPSGFAALDALLPGGGWPLGGLTEILLDDYGIGELRLFAPALAALSQHHAIAWINPPYLPYAPALRAQGLRLEQLVVIQPGNPHDCYWALEQTLRSGAFSGVLAWSHALKTAALRRLQLAAESSQSLALLFSRQQNKQPVPIALRMHLQPVHTPSGDSLKVHFLKRRGTWAADPLYLAV